MKRTWVDSLQIGTAEMVVQVPLERLAERLRIRKGQKVRFTRDGVADDYRVTRVSMPDEVGRVTVSVEFV